MWSLEIQQNLGTFSLRLRNGYIEASGQKSSENVSKGFSTVYHITIILFPLSEIVVAEHDGDGSF